MNFNLLGFRAADEQDFKIVGMDNSQKGLQLYLSKMILNNVGYDSVPKLEMIEGLELLHDKNIIHKDI